MSVKPLTQAQQQLIEDYLKQYEWQLYKCIHKTSKHTLTDEEFEELRGNAYLGLCKAARNFSPNGKMKFSSFAYLNVASVIKDTLKSQRTKKNQFYTELQSLDEIRENMERETICADIEDLDNNVSSQDIIAQLLSKMTKFEQKVTKLFMEGYSIAEIATKLKHSERDVYNVKNVTYKKTEIRKEAERLDLRNKRGDD